MEVGKYGIWLASIDRATLHRVLLVAAAEAVLWILGNVRYDSGVGSFAAGGRVHRAVLEDIQ